MSDKQAQQETRKENIVVICFGNSCRSPMGEVLLKKELERLGYLEQFNVQSAGLLEGQDGRPASAHSVSVMEEMDLDISSHRTQHISALGDKDVLKKLDHVFVVEEKLVPQLVELGVLPNVIKVLDQENDGIKNPYQQEIDVYRECAEILQIVMNDIAHELCARYMVAY